MKVNNLNKTVFDLLNGRFIDAWDDLSTEGKVASIIAGGVTVVQFAMHLHEQLENYNDRVIPLENMPWERVD